MVTVSGGDKFDKAMADLARKLGKRGSVQVGFLENAKYPDGTSVAMVAATQNYGNGKIPPRPFFTNMVAAKSPEWPAALAQSLDRHDNDVAAAMNDMGMGIAGQLQQAIIDTNSPALSPITLMLRQMRHENPDLIVTGRTVGEAARRVAAGDSYAGASTKPLVDTNRMLRAVDYMVDA
jgi:hypothetical protein